MKLNFDIYLSGRVQKLHGLKPADLQKEADITLRPDWWSVWRCEHLVSDKDGKHLFIFTNATCYYSIIVFRDTLELVGLLQQFQKRWLDHLETMKTKLPQKLEIHTRIIKGNPRSLTAVMNNIIYHTDYKLFEREVGYDSTEDELNSTPWAGPNYTFPMSKTAELLKTHPIGG